MSVPIGRDEADETDKEDNTEEAQPAEDVAAPKEIGDDESKSKGEITIPEWMENRHPSFFPPLRDTYIEYVYILVSQWCCHSSLMLKAGHSRVDEFGCRTWITRPSSSTTEHTCRWRRCPTSIGYRL